MTRPIDTLESARRPLIPAERRLLRAKIRRFRSASRRVMPAHLGTGGVVLLGLWLWTLLASDAPWPIITAFWLVVGGGIALWVYRDTRAEGGQLATVAERLESALHRNEADVYTIRARAFAEFEEIEDEGACYAFELERDRVVFIVGQQFYPEARFPSLDFSLVYPLDEAGATVDELIEKRGVKTAPARTIPASVKDQLETPGHLEVRAGRLEGLESSLRRSPRH